jgi:Na+/proline symporter
MNDFYRTYVKPDASDDHYLKASRFLTLAWGILLIAVATVTKNWGEVLEVGLTITSVVMGSVLGVFLLGSWTRKTTQTGALAGMAAGLIVTCLVHFSGAVAWTWYVLIGAAVTFVVGMLEAAVKKD